MRIAQVAPLYESVPPLAYGATERIVSYLTEELVRRGHDVTLYACADSTTAAKLVPVCERGLWRDSAVWDTLTHHVRELALVARDAAQFDVVHFHGEPLHFALAPTLPCRTLTTMHGLMLPADHGPLFRECPQAPLVSISDSQRKPVAWANWLRTVYHGLPLDEFALQPDMGSYLLFLGRMMPEKRPDLAIEIARRSGVPLKMAAKLHPGERDYFQHTLEPLLRRSSAFVDYLGEVGGDVRKNALSNARALVFPIDWEEPFGLTLIEAMACGTPVIAFRRGAVPEIVEDGVNGFIVDSVDEAVEAVAKVGMLDRAACRRSFEARFSATRMADDYLRAYETLLDSPSPSSSSTSASASVSTTAPSRQTAAPQDSYPAFGR